jgi:hypothetical protein
MKISDYLVEDSMKEILLVYMKSNIVENYKLFRETCNTEYTLEFATKLLTADQVEELIQSVYEST